MIGAETVRSSDYRPEWLTAQFWQYVDRPRKKVDACWPWLGTICHQIPTARVNGQRVAANLVAWELEHGPRPQGHLVYPQCGQPRCVNPKHQVCRPCTTARDQLDAFLKMTEPLEVLTKTALWALSAMQPQKPVVSNAVRAAIKEEQWTKP